MYMAPSARTYLYWEKKYMYNSSLWNKKTFNKYVLTLDTTIKWESSEGHWDETIYKEGQKTTWGHLTGFKSQASGRLTSCEDDFVTEPGFVSLVCD